jgi:hypothetical protein
MHQVGTKGGDILLEPSQHGLAHAKGLDGFLIGAGEKVLIVRRGEAEDVAQNMRKRKAHGCDPFHYAASLTLDRFDTWCFYIAMQQPAGIADLSG